MDIIKELERLRYDLDKHTYGDCLSSWVIVELLLQYFRTEKKKREMEVIDG